MPLAAALALAAVPALLVTCWVLEWVWEHVVQQWMAPATSVLAAGLVAGVAPVVSAWADAAAAVPASALALPSVVAARSAGGSPEAVEPGRAVLVPAVLVVGCGLKGRRCRFRSSAQSGSPVDGLNVLSFFAGSYSHPCTCRHVRWSGFCQPLR